MRLIAPSSLFTVHLRNLTVSSPLEVSSSFSFPPSSRRKKIPYRELWKIPFCHCACASHETLKQTLDELPSVDSERKKWGAEVMSWFVWYECNITHWGPSGGFSGQFVNCLPVLNDCWVAELVLLCHDLLSLCICLHTDVAEAILRFREQAHVIKDANGLIVAHWVDCLPMKLIYPTSGPVGHLVGT